MELKSNVSGNVVIKSAAGVNEIAFTYKLTEAYETGKTYNIGEIPSEFFSKYRKEFWVNVGYGVHGFLEIASTGEVTLSKLTSSIPSGIWISVCVAYLK